MPIPVVNVWEATLSVVVKMKKEIKNKTKALAISAVLSAVGVVLMGLGSIVEVMDLSLATLASISVIFAVIEFGGIYPWLMYLVTSVLSMLLLPNKFPAIAFFGFLGYYPIIKEKIEGCRRVVRIIVKLAIFNGAMAVMLFTARLFSVPLATGYLLLGSLLLLNLTFWLYDYALSVMVTAYIHKFRKRFKIDKMLK